MLSVLVVDDDARVARNHADCVASMRGFAVTAVVHTGAAALEAVEAHRPDLVLLDLYLPDMSGIDVLRQLRTTSGAGGTAPADVLVISALRDVDSVRRAMHGGAVYYLIKPFDLDALREQLERFAATRDKLSGVDQVTQRDVDSVFGVQRPTTRQELPKGLTAETARLVAETLRAAGSDLSAVEVAERAGIARVTARRYLEYLCADGRAELRMRYGSAGRPEHRYRWVR
ncbi:MULTISPECIES: response regulator [Prauserella salsuginis group]|uniref:Transcriptional regulatory protein n=2 Tax=Prauserella salsuginis group TaxID=2893672 RepID=A0A839XPB2_9PSEU|nr:MULTISPECIES: response regulator [Prauserella salsuginis group]MBB3665682.1 two-component system CitB family response regulator [Prauserella sediminis]MCR3722874.1 two-component system, CitB family, response regulator [Prauserella flava]MCR3737451.1 two-component system, CitB family, response regulator [Prauserella salsuginis]